MKAKGTVMGSPAGKRVASLSGKGLRMPAGGHLVSSRLLRDFDARLEQAHRRADDVLAKLAKR